MPTFEELARLSEDEREEIISSGFFNTIIQGYCIMGMKQAGFTDSEVARVDFVHLFDSITAWEARRAANDE